MGVVNKRPNRLAIDALRVKPGDVVLELGFGPGKAIESLTGLVGSGRVLGIDHSKLMLAQATRRNCVAIKGGRVDLRQGTFATLPWTADSVDKILAVNVMYFFDTDGTEIREARRVLRPNGVMAAYVTEAATMKRWKVAPPETHRVFGRDDLLNLLQVGGFRADDIRIVSVGVGYGVDGMLAVACNRTSSRE